MRACSKDADKKEDYGAVSTRKFELAPNVVRVRSQLASSSGAHDSGLAAAAARVRACCSHAPLLQPVSNLDTEYLNATLRLSEEIEAYCTLDVYSKERIPLIKTLKQDAQAWVSKYARGGSARSQSARRMYIAADSVVGHLASSGCAA